MNKTTPMVVAYGGGVNSTAMLVGMKNRSIRPDLVLMANTGGEKPETLQWLSTFAAWLRDNDMPSLIIVANDGMYESLEAECLIKNTLPGLAFGYKSCSDKYKSRPQNKYVNRWQPAIDCWAAGKTVTKVIGYDADESHRAKDYADKKYTFWYPLVKWDWGRDECVEAIRDEGLMVPPKSSCFFCPAMRKNEIIDLKRRHPNLFQRALDIEAKASLTSVKGLGRNWSWKNLGKAWDEQMNFTGFMDLIEEPCGCFDGDHDGIDLSVVELSISSGCIARDNKDEKH